MRPIIPGHAKTATIPLSLVCIAVILFFGGQYDDAAGIVVALIGLFLVDQSTHLAQPAHRDPAPTWIERQLQRHHRAYYVLGLVIAVGGFCLVVF